MSFLVISCSLNPESRSRIIARRAAELFPNVNAQAEFADLRDIPLPLCDGAACYDDPNVQIMGRRIKDAEGVILATPIYNYGSSASAKNLIELTGDAWAGKVVGFLCAAGGRSSYMAVMNIANSLMLDFRAVILPRFLYTDESDFDGDRIAKPEIESRLADLVATLVHFGRALAP